MSVTNATLSAIQQAGQSVDLARKALAQAVAEHAQRVMTAVAEQPFSVDNDKLFSHWKTTARLAQEVQAIEEQFKTIYQAALGLVVPETPVLTALPQVAAPRVARRAVYDVDTSVAEDVEVKPQALSQKKKKPKAAKVAKATQSAVSAPPKPAVLPKPAAGGLSGNDAKVLDFLKTGLNRKSWRRVTQSAVATGAGIPKGSVGLALRRLMAGGHLFEGAQGSYKLG